MTSPGLRRCEGPSSGGGLRPSGWPAGGVGAAAPGVAPLLRASIIAGVWRWLSVKWGGREDSGKRRLGRLTGASEDRLFHSRRDWRRMGPQLCRKVRSF
jgi:hypothetical protein